MGGPRRRCRLAAARRALAARGAARLLEADALVAVAAGAAPLFAALRPALLKEVGLKEVGLKEVGLKEVGLKEGGPLSPSHLRDAGCALPVPLVTERSGGLPGQGYLKNICERLCNYVWKCPCTVYRPRQVFAHGAFKLTPPQYRLVVRVCGPKASRRLFLSCTVTRFSPLFVL
ncbi:hypothetical protein EMVG_00083 [Emiliania huxleyi virus PS401]|nr:hypothetical protein EMVG_00083 [Emiliania huxleyi virus PS401]